MPMMPSRYYFASSSRSTETTYIKVQIKPKSSNPALILTSVTIPLTAYGASREYSLKPWLGSSSSKQMSSPLSPADTNSHSCDFLPI